MEVCTCLSFPQIWVNRKLINMKNLLEESQQKAKSKNTVNGWNNQFLSLIMPVVQMQTWAKLQKNTIEQQHKAIPSIKGVW